MRFAIIYAERCTVTPVQADDVFDVCERAGLDRGKLDHGSLTRHLAIWVYEFSMFVPVAEQHYFSIGRNLYGGNAVIYQVDDAGETVDLTDGITWLWNNRLTFYKNAAAVEEAIRQGSIERPCHSINGVVSWRWPQPKPDLAAFARRAAGL